MINLVASISFSGVVYILGKVPERRKANLQDVSIPLTHQTSD